jgi:hypothetical protein
MTIRYQSDQIRTLLKTTEDKEKFLALLVFEGKKEDPQIGYISGFIGSLLKGNRLWFSWEDRQLIDTFNSKVSDQKIAEAMNTTRYAISARRKRLGLSNYTRQTEDAILFQVRQCINEKLTIDQAAKRMSLSAGAISKYCKKHGLSFRKYASDHHASKLSAYDRALISTLHDEGYMPEHISNALNIKLRTVQNAVFNVPSTERVDFTQDERIKPLLNCEKRFGYYLTPAEVELFETQGLDAFMDKTGRTEATSMMTFVYRQQRQRFQMMGND